MQSNSLTGAVPPELGTLTDLVSLCAAPRRLRVGDGRTRRARSVCVWLRSALSSNRFSGTLGSWVGSLAKLSYLCAPHARTVTRARDTRAQSHARHTRTVRACVCVWRVVSECVRFCVCVLLCVCVLARSACVSVFMCVCVLMCVCVFVCVC